MAARTKVDGRRERSRRTRERIVDAATRLFVEQGYVSTTVANVAEAAGVAVQTVYYTFGTKLNLLAGVLDASIAGDLEPIPVMERPWIQALAAERDAPSAVALLVHETLAIVARAAPVYEVIRRAAADPDVAALLADNRRSRRQGQREMVEILHQGGHLSPKVTVEFATDVVYALLNEEVFQLLVSDSGWPIQRYCDWATSTLVQQLHSRNPLLGANHSEGS